MAEIDRRLAAAARHQHMLVTLADVRAAGGDRHHVARRTSGGRWRRVDEGVYLLEGAPLEWATRQHAAVLSAGEGSAASHLAATRLWDVPGFARAGPELAIPRGRRYRRPDVRSHESTDLDRCRIVLRHGIPTTDADRTLLDLGRYVGVRRLTSAVEAGRRAGIVTWSSLIATLASHARRGRPGIRRLRTVILAGAHRDEVTDSDLELLLLGLMVGADLPEPVVHHVVLDGDRFVAEVDLAYPRWRIAIECDGPVHGWDEVRERDLPRQNDLVLLGWHVLRFSKDRILTKPETVLRDIRAAVGAARARAR